MKEKYGKKNRKIENEGWNIKDPNCVYKECDKLYHTIILTLIACMLIILNLIFDRGAVNNEVVY